jgi:hypothetical protein
MHNNELTAKPVCLAKLRMRNSKSSLFKDSRRPSQLNYVSQLSILLFNNPLLHQPGHF